MTHVHDDVDHDDVIVVDDRGSAVGTILGILVILGLLAAIWWFALGPGAARTGDGTDIDVNVPAPGEVLPSDAPPAS